MKAWQRLLDALGDAVPRLRLRPGASETALRAAEAVLGPLPEDYRAWLTIANGQEPGGLSILSNGGWLISIEQVLGQWQYERGHDLDVYESITQTQDRERIRWFVFHPRRITIGGPEHLDGDNWMIDQVPGSAGVAGQLIALTSECDFVVLAPSFSAYFDRVADLIESGVCAPRMFEDGEAVAPPRIDVWHTEVRGERRRKPRIKPPRKPHR